MFVIRKEMQAEETEETGGGFCNDGAGSVVSEGLHATTLKPAA